VEKLEDAYGNDSKSTSTKHNNLSVSLPKLGASRSVDAFSLHSEATVEST